MGREGVGGSGRRALQLGAQLRGCKGTSRSGWWERFTENSGAWRTAGWPEMMLDALIQALASGAGQG